jgi:hypothetical protein
LNARQSINDLQTLTLATPLLLNGFGSDFKHHKESDCMFFVLLLYNISNSLGKEAYKRK